MARPPKDETLCRYVARSGKCDFEEVRGFKCSFKHPPGTITVEMRKPINERLDYRNEPHSDREVWGQGRGPPPRSINDRIWGWDREDQGRASHESLPLRESVSFGYFEDRHREPYPSPSLNSLQSRENGRDRGRMLDLRHTIGRQDSSRDREWERERTGDNGWGQEPDNPAPFDRDLRRTIEDRRQREPPVAARGPDETARRDGLSARLDRGEGTGLSLAGRLQRIPSGDASSNTTPAASQYATSPRKASAPHTSAAGSGPKTPVRTAQAAPAQSRTASGQAQAVAPVIATSTPTKTVAPTQPLAKPSASTTQSNTQPPAKAATQPPLKVAAATAPSTAQPPPKATQAPPKATTPTTSPASQPLTKAPTQPPAKATTQPPAKAATQAPPKATTSTPSPTTQAPGNVTTQTPPKTTTSPTVPITQPPPKATTPTTAPTIQAPPKAIAPTPSPTIQAPSKATTQPPPKVAVHPPPKGTTTPTVQPPPKATTPNTTSTVPAPSKVTASRTSPTTQAPSKATTQLPTKVTIPTPPKATTPATAPTVQPSPNANTTPAITQPLPKVTTATPATTQPLPKASTSTPATTQPLPTADISTTPTTAQAPLTATTVQAPPKATTPATTQPPPRTATTQAPPKSTTSTASVSTPALPKVNTPSAQPSTKASTATQNASAPAASITVQPTRPVTKVPPATALASMPSPAKATAATSPRQPLKAPSTAQPPLPSAVPAMPTAPASIAARPSSTTLPAQAPRPSQVRFNPNCKAFQQAGLCSTYDTCTYFHKGKDCMDFFRKQACPNGSRCELDHRTCASLSHLEAKLQQAREAPQQRKRPAADLTPDGKAPQHKRQRMDADGSASSVVASHHKLLSDAGDARLKRMEEADKIIRDMAAGGVHEGGPGTRQATQNSAHPLAKVPLTHALLHPRLVEVVQQVLATDAMSDQVPSSAIMTKAEEHALRMRARLATVRGLERIEGMDNCYRHCAESFLSQILR